jgi:uncharacterized protein YycO
MSAVDLLFCTNPRNPLSWAIRASTWSPWSHVGIVDGDSVIEAVALKGVVRTPLRQRQDEDPRWAISQLPCCDPKAVIAAAASQIGKPYDYTAVIGLGLHRVWKDAHSWFCSELAAWALDEAGSPLFRADSMRRVTPQDLWMLHPADVLSPPRSSTLAVGKPAKDRP